MALAKTDREELSFTEKKRVRADLGTGSEITHVPVPGLLLIQQESYEKFLQPFSADDQRKEEGLQSAFNSVFPTFRIKFYI